MKGGARGEGECLTFYEQMFLIFSPAVPFLNFIIHHLAWDNPVVLLGRFRKKPYNSFFYRLRVMKVLRAS